MNRLCFCLIAACAACVAAASPIDSGKVYDFHFVLQRPGLPDQKPALKVLGEQEGVITWGQRDKDMVTIKVQPHLTGGRSTVLFSMAGRGGGGFTTLVPAGSFRVSFSTVKSGYMVARVTDNVGKHTTEIGVGPRCSEFNGWNLVVSTTVEQQAPAAP